MKRKNLFAALLCAVTSFAQAASESLDEMVVIASRFPDVPESLSVNVTVITAADIEKSAAKTVPALLAQRAGIQVRSADGTPDMAIDLRGFGMTGNQNTLVLLDGQPLNDIELTSIRWSSIPLASIERIEIMNGSGAVLYGGGATGGTVNIITKRAKKEGGGIGAGYGSFNSREWQLALSNAGDHLGMRVAASGLDSDNYRANNNISQKNLEADLRADAGQGEAVLKFGADTQSLRYPGPRTVDPTIGLNQLATVPRGTSTPLDYGNRDGSHVSLGTMQKLEFGQLAGELSYRNKKQQAYFDYGGGFSDYLDTKLDLISFTPRMEFPFQLGGTDNKLVMGVDFANWDYDSRRSSNPATVGTPTAHLIAKQSDRALYVQNATQLGADTKLTLGARTQHVDYQARDAVNPAAYAAGNQGRAVTAYEIGLRQSLDQDWALYGRVGRSFRIATVDEIFAQYGGPMFDSKITLLEPQISQDSEVGVDFKNASSRAQAVLFQMNLNNEIHYNAITFTNMNLSPTRRYGVGLEGSHNYTEALEVSASYSYTVAKFREGIYGGVDVAGNTVPLVPRQKLVLSSSWKTSESTTLSGSANYVGKQYFDNDQANTFAQQMPAYTTVDMKLAHREGAWLLAATVNNLFNRQYFTYGVASNFTPGKYNAYPMQGRNLWVNANYQF